MKNWHYLQRSVPSHFFCQIFQKFIFPKMSIYYVFRSAESESGIHFSLRGFRTRICQHLPRKCQHLKMLLYRVKRDFFAFLGSRNPNIIQDFHILHCYQDFVLESDDDESGSFPGRLYFSLWPTRPSDMTYTNRRDSLSWSKICKKFLPEAPLPRPRAR